MQKTTIHHLTIHFSQLTELINQTVQTSGTPIPGELSKMIVSYVPFLTLESLQSFVPTFPLSTKYSNTQVRYIEFINTRNQLDKEANWQGYRPIDADNLQQDSVTGIPLFLPLIPTKI